jgi:hypothetical protein
MQIFVKPPSGKIFIFDFHREDRIATVKAEIWDKLGISPDRQRLTFANTELKDPYRIADYNIHDESTLHLLLRTEAEAKAATEAKAAAAAEEAAAEAKAAAEMRTRINRLIEQGPAAEAAENLDLTGGESYPVFVKTLFGMNFTLQVKSSDTIYVCKVMIQDRTGVEPDGQRLVHLRKGLNDDMRTLEECGIGKESTLHMMMRRSGGYSDVKGRIDTDALGRHCILQTSSSSPCPTHPVFAIKLWPESENDNLLTNLMRIPASEFQNTCVRHSDLANSWATKSFGGGKALFWSDVHLECRVTVLELSEEFAVESSDFVALHKKLNAVRYNVNGVNAGYWHRDTRSWQRYTRRMPIGCKIEHCDGENGGVIRCAVLEPLVPGKLYALALLHTLTHNEDKLFPFKVAVPAAAEAQAAAEASAADQASHSNFGVSPQSLPPGFIDTLRGAAGLVADISCIKQEQQRVMHVLGDAAALTAHAKVTQQQLDDKAIIQGKPELLLFYGAVCQGLQSMLHIAAAFKTGSVQLDKNSSLGSHLRLVSDHHDSAVDTAGKAASRASDLAEVAGSFEGAANAMASALDKVAEIADGIPVASFVLKGISCIVNQVQGLKFDARMNRIIKSLFPNLSPLAWTCVVEEVARRTAVLCAPEIQVLHSGTEDRRGRAMNWFRTKCSDYGLATLTSKAEDAVVMMALQKVDRLTQLALSGSFPEGLSEEGLAEYIIQHAMSSSPVPAPTQSSAVCSVQPSSASPGRWSPPPHDVASHDEVEELRSKLDEQDALNKQLQQKSDEQDALNKQLQHKSDEQDALNKQLQHKSDEQDALNKQLQQKSEDQNALNKQLQRKIEEHDALNEQRDQDLKMLQERLEQLAPQDSADDATGGGGGLVMASRKKGVDAEIANPAAEQAERPLRQQQIRIEHRMDELADELAAFMMSLSDPVLKSNVEDLNNETVAVWKKHDGVPGWHVRKMAVRRGTLFYGDNDEAVKAIIARGSAQCSTDPHIIDLRGCSVVKCSRESNPTHFAFVLTTAQVSAWRVLQWL